MSLMKKVKDFHKFIDDTSIGSAYLRITTDDVDLTVYVRNNDSNDEQNGDITAPISIENHIEFLTQFTTLLAYIKERVGSENVTIYRELDKDAMDMYYQIRFAVTDAIFRD